MAALSNTWGNLADSEAYGRQDNASGEFLLVKLDDIIAQNLPYRHACHAMIFAKTPKTLWNLCHQSAIVMMQMRFDGLLGFPGGLVDETDNDIVDGLNRELLEEIKLDTTKYKFTASDHVVTHVHHRKKLILNFYAKEVAECDVVSIERNTLEASDWGVETMGIVRVPLFIMADKERGLPLFLKQGFAGNAKEQLLTGIRRHQLISEKDLSLALGI